MLTSLLQDFVREYALYAVIVFIILYFVVVAALFKTYPTFRMIVLVGVLTFFAFVNFVLVQDAPRFQMILGVFDTLVLCALTFDLALVVRSGGGLNAVRETDEIASLQEPHDVVLHLNNSSNRAVVLDYTDDKCDAMATMSAVNFEEYLSGQVDDACSEDCIHSRGASVKLDPGVGLSLAYRIVWKRRGAYSLDFVAIRLLSVLKFWRSYRNLPCHTTFRVYPNLCQLNQLGMFGLERDLRLLGLRIARRVGQDGDFERLRDYTPDDQYKFIDWKATARRGKIMVRDFQTQKNQQIVIALDSGRMTMNSSDGVTYFDTALNASLALAYIALKQGDKVGFLIFSDEVRLYVPPRGGISHVNTLIRSVFDIFPERVESRYDRAFSYLTERLSKRSMVVLVSNVIDQRNGEQVETHLTRLVGKHLPVGLFLQEASLFNALDLLDKTFGLTNESVEETGAVATSKLSLTERQYRRLPPQEEIERAFYEGVRQERVTPVDLIYRAGVAADILNWRHSLIRSMEHRGALTLDVAPNDAMVALINKYLEIKARNLL
ncbi:MAG: DUF58 domain-containing protein [Planctomycetia bacterium]|nr:DUF58 domain-containing protein [Planctomycetia bacterium]